MKVFVSLIVVVVLLAAAPEPPPLFRVLSYQWGAAGRSEIWTVVQADGKWHRAEQVKSGGEAHSRRVFGEGRIPDTGRFRAWRDRVRSWDWKAEGEVFGKEQAVDYHGIIVYSSRGSLEVKGVPNNYAGRNVSEELRSSGHGKRVEEVATLVADMESLAGPPSGE